MPGVAKRRLVRNDLLPASQGGHHAYPLFKSFIAPQRDRVKQPIPPMPRIEVLARRADRREAQRAARPAA